MAFRTADKDVVRLVTDNIDYADGALPTTTFTVPRGQTTGDIRIAGSALEQTAATANEPSSARWHTIQVTPTRTRSFRASAAIRVVSENGKIGDVAWGFTWPEPENLFAIGIVAIVWLFKTGNTAWEIRSRWSGTVRDKSITWGNNSWMRVGFEIDDTSVNFYYNETQFVTAPTAAEDVDLILFDEQPVTAGSKGASFDTRAVFMAVQFSGNVGATQNHGCDTVQLEELPPVSFPPPTFPAGAFFSTPDAPYARYKTGNFVHDLFTNVRII